LKLELSQSEVSHIKFDDVFILSKGQSELLLKHELGWQNERNKNKEQMKIEMKQE
jgi:uncharacterized protein YeaC (DUF1315 family)